MWFSDGFGCIVFGIDAAELVKTVGVESNLRASWAQAAEAPLPVVIGDGLADGGERGVVVKLRGAVFYADS